MKSEVANAQLSSIPADLSNLMKDWIRAEHARRSASIKAEQAETDLRRLTTEAQNIAETIQKTMANTRHPGVLVRLNAGEFVWFCRENGVVVRDGQIRESV